MIAFLRAVKERPALLNRNFRPLFKVSLLVLLAGGIIILAFVSGMIFQANFYGPAQAAAAAGGWPALSAGPQVLPAPATGGVKAPEEFATFWEAWSFLNEQFYGDIPADQARVYGAIKGMVASFNDQHTSFIDPVRASIISENMQG